MFEKIRNLKNKKGFTLVELIVVLVILAILAALLVPALTGYIDKANKEKIVAATRQLVVAAQTEASEAYGKGATFTAGQDFPDTAAANSVIPAKSDVLSLAEITLGTGESVTFQISTKGVITEAALVQGGHTCTYTQADGQYKVS